MPISLGMRVSTWAVHGHILTTASGVGLLDPHKGWGDTIHDPLLIHLRGLLVLIHSALIDDNHGRDFVKIIAWVHGPALQAAGLERLASSFPWLDLASVATKPADVIAGAFKHRPDVTLIIAPRVGPEPYGVVKTLRIHGAAVAVVIEVLNRRHIERLIRLGVQGIFSAAIQPDRLFRALPLIKGGATVLDPHSVGLAFSAQTTAASLTEREGRIAVLIARGVSNEEISRQLSVSCSTLKRDVRAIRSKLQVKSRSEIAARVANDGLDEG
jgi:DNA-binding NarL/FixJ family response regulator